MRSQIIVSESGLYKLIMRSDKPEAKAFQDWVTRDVLPAIRKDGGYIMDEEKGPALCQPPCVFPAWDTRSPRERDDLLSHGDVERHLRAAVQDHQKSP